MKISTKSRYGLRILVDIAINLKQGEATKGRDIAKRQDITEAYMEQIMIPLKSNGIVRALRGCKGGYIINKPLAEITVLDILECFEGKVSLVDCVDADDCKRLKICPTRFVWQDISSVIREKASSITIQDILDSYTAKNSVPDFII